MSERSPKGVDPDATVAMPALPAGPDPDATVAIPPVPSQPDPDATVAMPAPASQADPDATVALPEPQVDPDATVAIPTPGRKREPGAPVLARAAAEVEPGSLGGLNPLVAAANPILAVVPQIRRALRHGDPAGLRAQLGGQLDAFETAAQAGGVPAELLRTASFALCALLDESAACTPWGGDWARAGLLFERHGERDGGEKFFALLAAASEAPVANADLMEFFHVCLALGFEGRHRGSAEGRRALEEERAKAHALIRAVRPAPDPELSGRWRGMQALPPRVPGALALWGAASGIALALGLLYLTYSISLGARSDPVARALAQLRVPAPEPPPRAAPPPPAAPRLAAVSELLAEEIKRGLIAVDEAAERSTIVLRTDRLFASGSARVDPYVEPLLLRIAQALDRVPGTILVTGHSDDVPIRTARFPSNWELSTERARSVVALMAAKLRDAARLRAEGLADSVPIAPNDTEANRARNRRVELVVRGAP